MLLEFSFKNRLASLVPHGKFASGTRGPQGNPCDASAAFGDAPKLLAHSCRRYAD